MKKEIYYCDRCGAEIVNKGWIGRLMTYRSKVNILAQFQGNPCDYDFYDKTYELCNECTEQFREWIKDGSN